MQLFITLNSKGFFLLLLLRKKTKASVRKILPYKTILKCGTTINETDSCQYSVGLDNLRVHHCADL